MDRAGLSDGLTLTTRRPHWVVGLCLTSAMGFSAARAEAPETPRPAIYSDCRGEKTAAPTVVLESGTFGSSSDWDRVLADLAPSWRVCAYDRPGVGRSEPQAGPRDVVTVANNLRALLLSLGETQPIILVGHSNGALYAETYAALFPGQVAGLVYVDGVGSDDLDYPELLGDLAAERRLSNLAVIAGRLGLAPFIARSAVHRYGMTGLAAASKHASLVSVKGLRVARDEDREIIPGLTTARALGGSPSNIPTVVIVAARDYDSPLMRAWQSAETAPALRASRSWTLIMQGATHVSPLSRDRAYVIAAVKWLESLPHPDIGH